MVMKNPVLRSMFIPPADKALGDAEGRIGVDVLTLEPAALAPVTGSATPMTIW